MSSAEDNHEDEYKKEGRLMQLSPQEQMKYVGVIKKNLTYKGEYTSELSEKDILLLLREALRGKDLTKYTADSHDTYQAFLEAYKKREQQGGRNKNKKKSRSKSKSKSRSKSKSKSRYKSKK